MAGSIDPINYNNYCHFRMYRSGKRKRQLDWRNDLLKTIGMCLLRTYLRYSFILILQTVAGVLFSISIEFFLSFV